MKSEMAGYKRSYTFEEDNIILGKIVSTKSFHALKGVLFWKELENSDFKNKRSWMSLKNRFIRSILPQIHNPNYSLSDSDKELIVNGYKGCGTGTSNFWRQHPPSSSNSQQQQENEVIVLSD